MEEKIKCLGNCVKCKALQSGKADEIVCPLRVIMVRTERIEARVTKVLSLLENEKTEKVSQSVEVEIAETGEEEPEEV